jgi:urease beta subunit
VYVSLRMLSQSRPGSSSEVTLSFDGRSKLGMRLDPVEGTVLRIDPGTAPCYGAIICA